jgi:cytochrome P450
MSTTRQPGPSAPEKSEEKGIRIPRARGVPLLGSVPYLARDPFGFCMRAAAEGDGLVRLDAGPVRAYLVSHPDYVRQVLVGNAGNYVKGKMMDGIRLAMGNGLFVSDGDFWRRQRRLMQPAFHAQQIGRMSEAIGTAVARGVARWGEAADRGEPIDLLAETIHVNIQIVVGALFGATADEARADRLLALTDRVFRGMAERVWAFFLPAWVPTPGGRAYARSIAELEREVYDVIAERRAEEQERHDLLGALLAVRDEDTGEVMSDRQLRDEIFTLFLAGNESTATGVTWIWHLLTRNPAVVDRLNEEVTGAFDGPVPALERLADLPYTKRVVSEGLRHYPTFPMYFRESVGPDEIGPYHLPAGANVVISPYATHHDPRHWDDPERFDPDRFLPERFDAKARAAYYPFGRGQRMCIGEPMSLAIAHTLVAALARNFDVTAEPGEVGHRYAMSLQPKGGLRVRLSRR